jgi:hypothetical protein
MLSRKRPIPANTRIVSNIFFNPEKSADCDRLFTHIKECAAGRKESRRIARKWRKGGVNTVLSYLIKPLEQAVFLDPTTVNAGQLCDRPRGVELDRPGYAQMPLGAHQSSTNILSIEDFTFAVKSQLSASGHLVLERIVRRELPCEFVKTIALQKR